MLLTSASCLRAICRPWTKARSLTTPGRSDRRIVATSFNAIVSAIFLHARRHVALLQTAPREHGRIAYVVPEIASACHQPLVLRVGQGGWPTSRSVNLSDLIRCL